MMAPRTRARSKERGRPNKRVQPKRGKASTSSSRKSPNTDPPADDPKVSSPAQPPGLWPELLTDAADPRVKLGVDFGTANTCASCVVVAADEKILDYVGKIVPLHARTELARFPTVMAVVPDKEREDHAELVFAQDAIDALTYEDITCAHMIEYPKLGLVSDFEGVVPDDRPVLKSIHSRHQKALSLAKTFATITVKYPGKDKETVTLNTIDDAIIACLKYFLCLMRVSIAQKLQVEDHHLDHIFEHKTDVGFAVPAFWSDTTLNRFLHQIRAAGFPSSCRIWSEPKCALAAHIALGLSKLSPHARNERQQREAKPMLIVDVGAGTTDLASLKLKVLNDKTIEFQSVAESSGSLSGARLLDFNVENNLKSFLGTDLLKIRRYISQHLAVLIDEEEFVHNFDFELGRQSFDGSKAAYPLRYRRSGLPSAHFGYMTGAAIRLPQKYMITSHQTHARRVITLIDEQIAKIRETIDDSTDHKIEVLVVGGVTRSPFFIDIIKKHLEGLDDVTISGHIEDYHDPLVPIGCILSLEQPAIGGRFRVKEAYGIPIAKTFDPQLHKGSQWKREDAVTGNEARDLMDWFRMIGEIAEKKVEIYDWSVTLYNDDGSLYTKNPRKDDTIYPLVIKQDIFSTIDEHWGKQQHFEYKDNPHIKQQKVCEISLSQEECLQITACEDSRTGFYRNPRNGHWSFLVPVRITLQWLDVRASWTAEIPQSGRFTDDEDQAVWSKEVNFAAIEHHGHKVGEEMTDEEMTDSQE